MWEACVVWTDLAEVVGVRTREVLRNLNKQGWIWDTSGPLIEQHPEFLKLAYTLVLQSTRHDSLLNTHTSLAESQLSLGPKAILKIKIYASISKNDAELQVIISMFLLFIYFL